MNNRGENNGDGAAAGGGPGFIGMPVANGGAAFIGMPVATNATQQRVVAAIQADGVNAPTKADGSVDVVPYARLEIRVDGKFMEDNAAELESWDDCKKLVKWSRAKEKRRLTMHRLRSKHRDEKSEANRVFLAEVLENTDTFWVTNGGRSRRKRQTGLKEKARRVSRKC